MYARPSLSDIERVAEVRAPWCVTVYGDADAWLRGNHPSEQADAQIRSALDGLRIGGATPPILHAVRERLHRLAEPDKDAEVSSSSRSVAIFSTEDHDDMFVLTSTPEPWVGVADRFLIGPALDGSLVFDTPVYVLALSENRVRLVDVTAVPARLVEVPGLPERIESEIDLDVTGDRNTLARLRVSEDPKGRLRDFSRAIDRAVSPVLQQTGAALVIAAAQPLAGIYRSTTAYERITTAAIEGNHDADSEQRLAELAEPVIAQHTSDEVKRHIERLVEYPDRDLVLADLDEIETAARDGAIETLFVDTSHRLPVEGEAFEGRTTLDRVDELIRHAWAKKSTVIPVTPGSLPTPGPAAAILRYKTAAA